MDATTTDLLAELTLEEKALLCLGSDFWHTAPVPRLGIPAVLVSDGPHGLRVSAEVDERTLREIYLPAFERVVTQARPWTVMCAYNRVNGVHASQNRWLLTDVLRREWGYTGVVVSDWGAVHDRVAALAAGLDLEMPPDLGVSDAAIVAAVRAGTLDEELLDQAVARVLGLVHQAQAAGPPAGSGDGSAAGFDVDAHHALARATAAECAVLLKNDAAALPLHPAAGDVIAVVGEFARTSRYQGAGSSQVNPTRVDVALDELRAAVPAAVEVAYAAGFGVGATDRDQDLAAEAVALAGRAGTVVAFLGLPAADESEGFDRQHMDLPANQTALLPRLAAANPNLVVVLANGSAVRLSGWERHTRAILECWLSGQAAGGAAADLLLGAANPCGRLAETLPLRLEDNPSYLNFPGEEGHVRYGEGVFVGYRGYDAVGREVSYPFGHGLSYTSFDYRDLDAAVAGAAQDGDLAVTVTCTVANTGGRAGKEVVQLYVGDPRAQVARPVRELKAFAKVSLEPGQAATVTFRLDARDLSYWSAAHHRWVLEAGGFELAVGASRDLRLTTTLEVPAPPLPVRLDAMATLEEWLAHPEGSAALRQAVGVDDDGRPRGILGDDELIRVIGNFPLGSLAAFPGLGVDHATVADLVGRFQRRGAAVPRNRRADVREPESPGQLWRPWIHATTVEASGDQGDLAGAVGAGPGHRGRGRLQPLEGGGSSSGSPGDDREAGGCAAVWPGDGDRRVVAAGGSIGVAAARGVEAVDGRAGGLRAGQGAR